MAVLLEADAASGPQVTLLSMNSAGEGACAPRFYNLRSSAQICGKKVLGSPITRDHSDCFSSASSFPLRFKGFLGVSVVGFSAILAILT
jgi:hypothetical protein